MSERHRERSRSRDRRQHRSRDDDCGARNDNDRRARSSRDQGRHVDERRPHHSGRQHAERSGDAERHGQHGQAAQRNSRGKGDSDRRHDRCHSRHDGGGRRPAEHSHNARGQVHVPAGGRDGHAPPAANAAAVLDAMVPAQPAGAAAAADRHSHRAGRPGPGGLLELQCMWEPVHEARHIQKPELPSSCFHSRIHLLHAGGPRGQQANGAAGRSPPLPPRVQQQMQLRQDAAAQQQQQSVRTVRVN